MDNAHGGDPARAADDWRSKLHPMFRGWIVNRMMEKMKEHQPVLVPEGLIHLQNIAVRFEEKIYAVATSKADYLWKLSLKLLSMKSQNKTLLNQTLRASYVQYPGQQSIDNAQGGAPAADAEGDWRSLVRPEGRGRIVNRMLFILCRVETLKKHLPVSVPEGLIELQKIAVRFEEKMYTAATSQTDYLRKISLKVLTMESQNKTNAQENPQNGHVVQNQRPCFPETSGSSRLKGHPVVGDLKEELCQMNKTLKEPYVAGLGDLYEISKKLHGGEGNDMPTQEPKTVHEEVNFKAILEHSLNSIQINKKRPSPEESIPLYKMEIMSIIDSEEWKRKQTFVQSFDEQAPSTRCLVPPERGNAKRLRRS